MVGTSDIVNKYLQLQELLDDVNDYKMIKTSNKIKVKTIYDKYDEYEKHDL